MKFQKDEQQLRLLEGFVFNRAVLMKNIIDRGNQVEMVNNAFIQNLLSMPVTKLSIFLDNIWDFNSDVSNPSRNVVGAKLRIDFSKYKNIPPFIIIEMKCLFHLLNLSPLTFAKKGFKTKKGGMKKLAKKPNTFIAQFEAGLRFFEHLFVQLKENGSEYIDSRYRSTTDILEVHFEQAAVDFPYVIDSTITKFFYYLKHTNTKIILDAEIQVDFEKLSWPEKEKKHRKESLVLSNQDFEKITSHASSRVVEFLIAMNVEVADKLTEKHLAHVDTKEKLKLSPELINHYGIYRLTNKGYQDSEIAKHFELNPSFYRNTGKLDTCFVMQKNMKKKYGITCLNSIRRQVSEVYYAAAYLVGCFTGMRPSALSEIILNEKCIITEDGVDLIVSEDKKGKDISLNLFDDKWVIIPIVKDAIKAAKLLSKLKANNYLFSNMDTVSVNAPMTNMNSRGIGFFLENYFKIVLGKQRMEEIKPNAYMMRHTLAYQLHRAELGLSFISFQLKHFVDSIEKYTSKGASSTVTIGYGEIAERLTSDGCKGKEIRLLAEVERVKSLMDPDATYLGIKGKEHKKRLKKAFQGYMASGYTKEDIFIEMAEQGMAVINMGTGFCYGGTENFDESIPCIGTLRCNPIRCSNAIVTKAHVPKWREVYFSNKLLIGRVEYKDKQSQIIAAMNEAEAVLKALGEEILL